MRQGKKEILKYADLRRAARQVRWDLSRKGVIDLGRPKLRRKPRDPEKRDLLVLMAMARTGKDLPFYGKDGRLVLPWFRDYLASRLPERFMGMD